MGPISDFTLDIANQAADKISKNTATIDYLSQLLEEASAFTKSGRDITNPLTSKARMVSGAASEMFSLGPAEGKTVSQVTKQIATLRNENAILSAVNALGQEVAKTPVPPGTKPTLPVPSTPGFMSKLNPIIAAVQLLTYPSDLNSNESEELAARRNLK